MLIITPSRADTIDTSGQEPWEQCGYCHEYDGNTRMANFPRLAGQWPAYLQKQLEDFRAGTRAGTMTATAEMLSDDDIDQVVDYFSAQQPRRLAMADQQDDMQDIAEQIYLNGDESRDLVACASCHGRNAGGQGGIPVLAAQQPDYVQQQLQAFRDGTRANDSGRQMRDVAMRLSDHEIAALAGYLARLTPVGADLGQGLD